ncbi:hypothetical protein GCM10009551_059310 [Nocardiopsis tropica]|uniref:hypothetical protein n=1 Tax=Tsukamurella strandjordii TaxID=147577 RepID=UPI0031CFF0E0
MPIPDVSDLPPNMQMMAQHMQQGAMSTTVTASAVQVVALSETERHELLSKVDSETVIIGLAEMQAELDAATIASVSTIPDESRRFVDTRCYAAVQSRVAQGGRVAPPQTMSRLMREVIETSGGGDGDLSDDDLLSLLLSINEEHDSIDSVEAVLGTSDPRQFDAKMRTLSKEQMHSLASDIAADEAAAMLLSAPWLPEYLKCATNEFWFSPWSPKVTGLGDIPADTFRQATGLAMEEFLFAGDLIMTRLRVGRARIDLATLRAQGASDPAIDYINTHLVRDIASYRDLLVEDRDSGGVETQRYTFTEFPFLRLDDGSLLALHAQWGMDRFFGSLPELDVKNGFDRQGETALVNKFQNGVKHQFEEVTGRTIARIADLSTTFSVILGEEEMQDAWKVKKGKPKACDWVLPTPTYSWIVDATHRPLRAELAEGLAGGEAYSDNLETFLTKKKYLQFDSVIDHLTRLGWEGASFTSTAFAPFVVVPDSGLPSTPLSNMLATIGGAELVNKYPGRVLWPAVVTTADLMLIEGVAGLGVGDVADMIRVWRSFGPIPLQMFLAMSGFQALPCPSHVRVAASELDNHVRATARQSQA